MFNIGSVLLTSVGVVSGSIQKAFPTLKPPPLTALMAKDTKISSEATELALATPPEHNDNESRNRLIASTVSLGLTSGALVGLPWLVPFGVLSTGVLAAPIFEESYQALVKEKKIKVDILDSTVIALCMIFGQVAAGAFMVWILHVADLLLDSTTRKSHDYLTTVFGEQVREAWLWVDDTAIQVAVEDLKKGDRIIINTGEQIPVDGMVIDGDAMVDQQSLTGESVPAEKRVGDQVFAMTVIVAGKIIVEVVETGDNTLAAKIVQIIKDTAEHKVRLQSLGEKRADQMVIPTLALGAMSYALKGSSALLATINADFGTGIRVAAPIALMASLGNAAREGILVKDSQVLEHLLDVDVVIFDKTGTLTHDVPKVSRIITVDEQIDPDQVLRYTATAEQQFSHPIASAILQKAEERNLMLAPLDDSQYHVGFGIVVTIEETVVKVGSIRYMERENIDVPDSIQNALTDAHELGNSAILVAFDGKMVGLIEMQSTPRDEAVRVVEFLKTSYIDNILLISGDHEMPTRSLAGQLGIEQFHAGVLPHEKADYVRHYQERGHKVMMVGDGINDSAALSLADISVSLQGASTIAVDVADVIFMDGSLKKFEYLFEVSKRLNRNVQRSFLMIAIPNTICIAGAMTGVFGLYSSLVLNNGFNFLAAANGTLPLFGQEKKEAIDL
ncbi:MAG: heavy metal translocating P-type ATPase [Chloroflexota bacterium]